MRLISSLRCRAALLAALFVLAGLASLVAETSPDASSLPRLDREKKEHPLLRFEIVSLGSYPITLFYVGFAFDLQRFFAHGRDSAYAPWPFNGSSSVSLDNSERLTRLGVALGLSFTVGAIDAIVHASKIKAARRLREAKLSVPPMDESP